MFFLNASQSALFKQLSIALVLWALGNGSLNAQDISGASGYPVVEQFGDTIPIDSPIATPDSEPVIGNGFGRRQTLAERGILLNFDVTQFYQGVTSGGLEQRFRYGGHGDYVAKFDFDKLIGREGLFLQLRAEHRFGQAVNLDLSLIHI